MEQSCNYEDSIKVGPWGNQGGTHWSFKPKGWITEIIISHGWHVDSISFKSDDGNGTIEYSKKFGGDGGRTDKILLDSSREYLTSISGSYEGFTGIIQFLCFHTNRTKYGPYGIKLGNNFSLPMEGGVIVGFHGHAGGALDAIGVYVKYAADVLVSCPIRQGQIGINNVVMEVEAPREAGPWGGHRGKSWDDGVFTAVQEVYVHARNGIVHAVQFFYLGRDGKAVWSKKHGGGGGGGGGEAMYRIKLDCSGEYLVGMMGFCGLVEENGGFEAIRSLSFYTNKGKYGPFGTEIGTAFGSPTSNGKIVGFHGRCGAYIDALGVHMEYF